MNAIDVVLGMFNMVGYIFVGVLSFISVLIGLAIIIGLFGYIFLKAMDYFNDPQRWV